LQKRDIIHDPYAMRSTNLLDSFVLKSPIAATKNVRLADDRGLQNKVVIRVADHGWVGFR
jgi:hypothetical protein